MVRLFFCNFYTGFNPNDNYLIHFLNQNKIPYTIDDKNPDIVLHSVFSNIDVAQKYPRAISILDIGEPFGWRIPADIYLGFKNGPRSLRVYPYRYSEKDIPNLFVPWSQQYVNSLYENKKYNVLFLYSNCSVSSRNRFAIKLNEKIPVDFKGKCRLGNEPFNNEFGVLGSPEYLKKMSRYKFVICFENVCIDGYVSEKIIYCFLAGCIPIYFGDPNIYEQFNIDTFLKLDNDTDQEIEKVINDIIVINKDSRKYKDMLSLPKCTRTFMNEFYRQQQQLQKILQNCCNKK